MEPRATRLLRRPRLLIVGCGDVGLRVLRLLRARWRVLAVTSSPQRRKLLRAAGATPLVADHCALPRVPRLTRGEAQQRLSPLQMSFLAESRRLDNTRMKRELRLVLRYPTVEAALASLPPPGPAAAGPTPPPGGATRLASA